MALTAYALLHAVWKGHMSPDDAAEALGVPARNVKTQVNYFGDRLENLATTLDELTTTEFGTRNDLAAAKKTAAVKLGISTRQLNRFLRRSGLKPRPALIKSRESAAEKATDRKRQHHLLAIDVLYNRKTLAEAANLSGRHERSIRRVLDELPIPVRYPDFDQLTQSTRYALAKNVEENRDCEHLAGLVNAQIQRDWRGNLPQTVAKPLISMLIAWLEGETEQYDPGYEHFLNMYGLKGVPLAFWEELALADELRNLL